MTGSIFLGATSYSVGEQENSVTFTIERTGDVSGPVTVQYATNADSALAGTDFVDTDGSVTLAAGQERATVTIPILDDDLAEPTEKFNISLITISSGTLLFPRTANVSILDDENLAVDPQNPPLVSDYDVTLENVITGVDKPLNMEWVPGSNSLAFVVEFDGRIKIADVTEGQIVSTALDISDKVNSNRDGGMLDIALHPDFETNPYLYAFYVVDPADTAGKTGGAGPDGDGNRFAYVSRFTVNTDGQYPVVDPDSEVVLVGSGGQTLDDISGGGALNYADTAYADARASDVDPVTGEYVQDYIKMDSSSHVGGALAFGPDGKLYIGTGDGTSFNYADPKTVSVQSTDALAGKILRVDPLTGKGLEDNPFYKVGDDINSNSSKVWQLGLRNPYAMAFAEDGDLFISETGWFGWEEINSGEAGANFGWPWYEGGDNGVLEPTNSYRDFEEAQTFYQAVADGEIEVTAAYRAFSHDASDPGYQFQAIVGGSSVYTGDKYPEVFKGDYFFHDIVKDTLFSVDTNDRTQLEYLGNVGASNPVVNMVQGPDGYLYAMVLNGSIKRLLINEKGPAENTGPYVANAISKKTAIINETFNFVLPEGTFLDDDGDELSLTASLSNGDALPDWLTFDPATGTFSGTPADDNAKQLTITVVATDADGLTTFETFNLVVAQQNDAPVLVSPAFNQTAETGGAFEYVLPTDMFVDDGEFTLEASMHDGDVLPDWLVFDGQTGSFSGTPQSGDEGRLIIKVTATDAFGEQVYDYFMINVEETENAAPVVELPLVDQTVDEETAFSYTFDANSFTDLDGDDLTYSARLEGGSDLPDWLTFEADSRRFSGTPDDADVGQLAVEVTASDPGGKSVTDVFVIAVNGVNDAPQLATPLIDKSVSTEEQFVIPVPEETFSDADDDTLALSIEMVDGSAVPSWIQFGPSAGGQYVFSGNPPAGTSGSFDIRVIATDAAGLFADDEFTITIGEGNSPPVVAAPLADQTAKEDEPFSFSFAPDAFEDPDQDLLDYYAFLADGSQLPDWLSFDPDTRTFSGTPDDGDVGEIDIEVTAVDPIGERVSDVFRLVIGGTNDAPVVSIPIADQDAREDTAFSLILPEGTFTDADDETLVLTAARVDGSALPSWLSFDADTLTFSGTPLEGDGGEFEVRVTATDALGASVFEDFKLSVDAVNDAPVLADPIEDQNGETGAAFSFALPQGVFTDSDDENLSLTVSLSDGSPLPGWLSFDAQTRTLSGTPAESDVGEFVIKVTATDAGGLTASDEFVLSIGASNSGETLYNDIAGTVQFLTGTTENDVFVINSNSTDFGWGPTEDGQGIVVWSDAGPDLLFGFEELRFNDISVSLVQAGSDYKDIPFVTQHLTGSTGNDTFIIEGNSSDYGWNETLDGEGIVVWGDTGHDLLYQFENIAFDDATIVLADTPAG